MTSFSKQKLLKYLGTLRGRGTMTIGNDQLNSCMISYEIDGYLERQTYLANGQIKGSIAHLARAFDAGAARIFCQQADLSRSYSLTRRAVQRPRL